MKIKFYQNQRSNTIRINFDTGTMSFKSQFTKDFDLKIGQRLRIGIDEDEKQIRHIYIVKSKSDDGYKIANVGAMLKVTAKSFFKNIGISGSVVCKHEAFKHGEYEGIKIILPVDIKSGRIGSRAYQTDTN